MTFTLRCHRGLRGPYTGGGELLRRIVPELVTTHSTLLERYATPVVAVAPDLRTIVPTPPQTLTNLASGEERTRYYAAQRTRRIAFAIAELARAWSDGREAGLVLYDVADADPTDVEVLEMLQRRCPGLVVAVHPGPPDVSSSGDLAQDFVDADGTSDDAAHRAAYDALTPADRRERHDARAQVLIERGAPGDELAALIFHLERGTDAGRAVPYVKRALNTCFNAGFYAAARDLARRGCDLVPVEADAELHDVFAHRLIGSLTYLDEGEEALEILERQRRHSTDGSEHMQCAYMLAMLYTRHLAPERKDHEVALGWSNTAIALADGHPDVKERAFFGAFMRNARALVELHRANVPGALELVEQAIGIADSALDPHDHALHRSVLLTNRGAVLAGLGEYRRAAAAMDEVIEQDPDYDEAYFDRASVRRSLGDDAGALADLDRAIALSFAFLEAHYNRADLLLEAGRDTEALADLDAVLEIDPDHLDALTNRAAIALSLGDLDTASEDIRLGLELASDSAVLWSSRGAVEAERDELDAAIASYTRAIDLDPQSVEAFANRAVAHFRSGRAGAAAADLDRAVELADCGALRVNRGIARQALDDHTGAVADFDAALGFDDVDAAETLFLRDQAQLASLASAP